MLALGFSSGLPILLVLGTQAARLPESPRALQHRFAVPVEKLGRILVVEDAWCAAIRAAITLCGAGLG